jgi:serine/threonine protein kinase
VVKGKFSYLSPEAARGQPVDGRTDIFAVGILAYEMLTMRRLFLGETDYQTVEMVRGAQVPSIRAQNPEVPEELENIIRKSLTRDLDQRYRTANEFADDLLGFLFARRLKVSARDLSNLLTDLREYKQAKEAKEKAAGDRSMNLIEQLMAEELANFRSIDEDSGKEAGSGATGARSLLDDELGDFDSSAPLVDGLDDLMGPDPGADPAPPRTETAPPKRPAATRPDPTPTPPEELPDVDDPPAITEHSIARTRLPSPPPKQTKSNAGIWILIVLLLLGGGGAAAAWYLGLLPLPM